MHRPVAYHQQVLQTKVENGEIMLGEEIPISTYTKYKVNKRTRKIDEVEVPIFARHIKLLDIRERILRKHKELGIVRAYDDSHYDNMTTEEVQEKLAELRVSDCDEMTLLKQVHRTRHFLLWHDHSEVAGHGYLLVLVTPIFDKAFYFTDEEMRARKGVTLNVQTVVEQPHIILIA